MSQSLEPARRQIPVIARRIPDMPPHPADEVNQTGGVLGGLFEDGKSVLRAIVAAEILAPPRALREGGHWQTHARNDRST
ncbi:MAG: hypothetical protein JOZ38_04135 [Candidatus Eremiobacteraeota bacterium]|nr:hypothetical protein [Candidatus Eremiobacteraeota bacterium]